MEGSPGSSTPMEVNGLAQLAEGGKVFDTQKYQQVVGSLLHLLYTRPELAFAVGKMCQYSAKPRTNHWTTIIRILRYVKTTIEYGIGYGSDLRSTEVIGYFDSDFAGDREDRKFTMGYAFLLRYDPLSCN